MEKSLLLLGYHRKWVLRTETRNRIYLNIILVLFTRTGIYLLRFWSIRNVNFKPEFLTGTGILVPVRFLANNPVPVEQILMDCGKYSLGAKLKYYGTLIQHFWKF